MANKKWGQKRHCAACAAAFYDLNRASIACPKCGAAFEAAALLKSDGRPRKKRGPTVAPPPAAAPPPPDEAELAESEVEHVLDPEDDDETADDAAEDEDADVEKVERDA